MANWLRNPRETPSAARPGRSGFNSTIRMRWLCSATSEFKRWPRSRLRRSFMLQKMIRLAVLLAGAVSFAFAQAKPIPQLVKNGDKYTFRVDGKPFLILGAQ